ncbi:MAG: c-type cytochrome [Paracoccaceae bacterium]
MSPVVGRRGRRAGGFTASGLALVLSLAALPARAGGDLELGAWLAGECITCHRDGAAERGIPPIAGWPEEAFAAEMRAYRSGGRLHALMQMLAGRLSDEEIAALAAWFAAQE